MLRSLARRDGPGRLFTYREGREWREAGADEVNAYLKSVTGGEFSAKDFRTWNGTVLAAVGLATRVKTEDRLSKTARKRVVNEVVKDVAAYLSNTPAVCRASYIDPRVFDLFDANATIHRSVQAAIHEPRPDRFPDREGIEKAVLRLLD